MPEATAVDCLVGIGLFHRSLPYPVNGPATNAEPLRKNRARSAGPGFRLSYHLPVRTTFGFGKASSSRMALPISLSGSA